MTRDEVKSTFTNLLNNPGGDVEAFINAIDEDYISKEIAEDQVKDLSAQIEEKDKTIKEQDATIKRYVAEKMLTVGQPQPEQKTEEEKPAGVDWDAFYEDGKE